MDEQQQQPSGTPDNPLLRDPAMPQPAPPPPPLAPSGATHRKKVWLYVLGGAGLALLVVGAVYWFVLRENNSGQQPQATNNQSQQQQEEVPAANDPTPTTFKSDKLNIEFTHRKDWTVKESPDGMVTVTSPQTSYAGADGTSKTGVFTLHIRKGASDAQRATIDKSIATKDSEVIAYAAPVEGQREYTNLTFAGPKDMFGFFIVTGSSEFKAGSPLMYALSFDSNSYLIAGGYGADPQASLSFDPVPKDLMDGSTLQAAIDLVESLKIY